MKSQTLKIMCTMLGCSALLALAGCECGKAKAEVTTVRTTPTETTKTVYVNNDLPPSAQPGECYAKVFIPPKTKTTTERVCIREASERVEIVPAEYEWVEERVLVKQASSQLEVEPAQFATRESTIEVEPSHVGWHMQKGDPCVTSAKEPVADVFCLIRSPAINKTVQTHYTAKPAAVREITIPAEYTTIRRQVVKHQATTRKIPIPADYTTVEKTFVAETGRMEWQKVICETNTKAAKINEVKGALIAAGYTTGPMDGKLGEKDWAAVRDFQNKHRLGVGGLTYVTMNKLGIAVN